METFIKEFNFKDEDMHLCDDLIQYHNNSMEYKFEGRSIGANEMKKSTDVTIYPSSQNPSVLMYKKLLFGYVKEYNAAYDNALAELTIADGFNIQHYKPKEGFYEWHTENLGCNFTKNRHLVFMTYLNTIENGGTEFYHQNLKTECKTGLTLIWPSAWTHIHRGIVSMEEDKYIITGWISFDTKPKIKRVVKVKRKIRKVKKSLYS